MPKTVSQMQSPSAAKRSERGTHDENVRHEEVAAFAAGADAHVSGQLAVCAGSCGPGNLHLINGLYDCHRNRVPVLAIAAQSPSAELGSGYMTHQPSPPITAKTVPQFACAMFE